MRRPQCPTFCTAFHRMGRRSRSLGYEALPEGLRNLQGGSQGRRRRARWRRKGGRASHGSEEEDVSGYGHKATKAEMERLHEEEQSEYILEDPLLMAAFVACCCLGAMGLGSRRRWECRRSSRQSAPSSFRIQARRAPLRVRM